MRLWTIHPKYLDGKGLVAFWREALLAKKCLEYWTNKKTCGYINHSQLIRFKQTQIPLFYINHLLSLIWYEALQRGYNFDSNKIDSNYLNRKLIINNRIPVTDGQIKYERQLLINKLNGRNKEWLKNCNLNDDTYIISEMFRLTKGDVELWEKV